MRWHRGKWQVLCKYFCYPAAEAEWQDYSPVDASWNEDRELVLQYQATHPPLAPATKKRSQRSKAVQSADTTPVTFNPGVTSSVDSATPVASVVSAHVGFPRRSSRLQG